MLRIRFTRNYLVKDGSGTSYKPGEFLEVTEASAAHFISRRAAELVESKASKRRSKPHVDSTPIQPEQDKRPGK